VTPAQSWNIAYTQLELQLDRASFDTWLRDAAFIDLEDDIVFVIGVKNGYARDMLQHRLYRNVRRVLSDVCGFEVELRFEVFKTQPQKADSAAMPLFQLLENQDEEDELPPVPLHERISRSKPAPLPESELNPRFTFDRFIVNGSNQITYQAARAVAEHPAQAYNPFLIYGGVGLGKTHLLQAIAHDCVERGLRTIYIPSEVFTNELVAAIREKKTAMFRDRYRSVDVLLVDDIQFIGGKDSTQEEFFHTFNALYTFNKQIILASDRHPSEMSTLDDRLRSRFSGGLISDVAPLEYESRLAILEMWMQERSIFLAPDVLQMLAERSTSNVRELEGVFNQVVAEAQLSKGSLTARRVEHTLERFQQPRHHVRGEITPESIITATADALNLMPNDITSKRRTGRVNQARQIAMYLMRELTELSLPQIGEVCGGRSHTTVLHGCNKIVEEMQFDDVLFDRVEQIRGLLVG